MKLNLLSNNLLLKFINDGTITLSETMNSCQEDIMKTILDKIHPYSIRAPKEGAKDQRWFTYVKDEKNPNGRRSVAANSKYELFYKLLNHYGVTQDSLKETITFGELYNEWVEYKTDFVNCNNSKRSRSMSTITRYRRDYDKCLKDTSLDSTPINSITSIQIENIFISVIKNYDLSESYVKNLFGYVKNTFEYAFRKRYLKTNEFLHVDKDRILANVNIKAPKSDEERTLTSKEQQLVYDAVLAHEERNPHYVVDYAVELAFHTGMRVGELATLRWSDIHDGYIHIDTSEHRVDYGDHTEFVVGEPKNRKHRKIPTNDYINRLFQRIEALGFNGEFVFTQEDGKRTNARSISCACTKRGLECDIKKVSIHRIRRTVISELRKDFDVKIVASLMGHLEQTDEEYYNYDNSEYSDKFRAMNSLCSSVFISRQ